MSTKESPKKTRRPYRAPKLKRLGSVREVTWGAGTNFEGGATGMGAMKK